jgi:hypothetical protein
MEYVQLIGAETVQSAAVTMRGASQEMIRAANHIEDSLSRHQRFLDDWLLRLADMLSALKDPDNG